jgi:hypothetical protein
MREIIEEHKRILKTYEKRQQCAQGREGLAGYEDLAHICCIHERHRETLLSLKIAGYHPFLDLHILDVW